MPGQLLLCLQLAFTLSTGFKHRTEQSGKQTKSILLRRPAAVLGAFTAGARGCVTYATMLSLSVRVRMLAGQLQTFSHILKRRRALSRRTESSGLLKVQFVFASVSG